MNNQKINLKTEKELKEAILREKEKGTQSKGLNISSLNVSKKIKTLYPRDFKEGGNGGQVFTFDI